MNLEIDGVNVHYEVYGEGIPTLCIHGFAVDSNLMKHCLEPIFGSLNNFQRIYIDLIGMGNSPANYQIKNSDDQLNLLIKLVDKLIGDKNFILFGESYGGYLSLGLINYFGNRIKGLFLICPCIVANHNDRNIPEKKTIVKIPVEIDESEKDDYSSFLDYAVVSNSSIWEDYKKSILTGVKKADFKYLNWFQKNGYSLSLDVKKVTFDNPTVFLLGRQDHIVGFQDALNLIENFPRGSFIVLDSAGHNLQIEQAETFNQVLVNFIQNFK